MARLSSCCYAGRESDLGQAERLQQRREVHAEPAAVPLAQAVPAADRVIRGPAPSLDRPVGGRLALVGRAKRHPAVLALQPGMEVVDSAKVVLERGGPHLAD